MPTSRQERESLRFGMHAVVLRGPANSAPEEIIGPFASLGDAEAWVELNPRPDGYCIAQVLTAPPAKDDIVRSFIQERWKR
jgi:hypothetical protein